MSDKRFTPQSRELPSFSRRHTPINLNTSTTGSVNRSQDKTSISLFKSQSLLNLNKTVSSLNGCPSIRNKLLNSNVNDRKLECEAVYNSYLQALMKQDIIVNTLKKHDQELKDQIIIQKYKLYKNQTILKKKRQVIEELNAVRQINHLMKIMQEIIDTLFRLNINHELCGTLEELSAFLDLLCKKVYLKNYQAINDQEDTNKLTSLLERCKETFEIFESSTRRIDSVNKLGALVKQYQQLIKLGVENQYAVSEQQKRETFNLLKSISNMYTQRESYFRNSA